MRMKNDAKFEEELTYQFKIDLSNLMNFESSTRKSKKFALFNRLLLTIYNACAKKVQRSCV